MLFVEAIFASKKEAVCCEVPAHFRSSLPARFTKRFLGAFSLLMHPKTKMSAVKFRQILKVFSMQTLWKSSWRNFTINASKNKAVCREVQTHFGSFLRASFIKTFLGAFSHFWHPQTKLFAVKFRRILEVLCLQGLWKKLCTNFHNLCAPKRSCLLWSSHTFCKFSACKVYRKSYGCTITIYACKNEAVCCKVQTHFGSSPPARFTEKSSGSIFTTCVSNKQTFLTSTFCKKRWPRFTILHPHKSLLCCSDTLWRSWLSHFIRTHYFGSEHIWTTTAPTNCDMWVWPYVKQFQKSLWLALVTCFVIS